jgi:hypothetical protein
MPPPSRQPLGLEQRAAVVYLAEQQGCACDECGSSEHLESDDEVRYRKGGFDVDLYCANGVHPERINALGKGFSLTLDQARRLRLKGVPPDEPPPRRKPGQTAP